ncbi:MAG: lauroyl acyltransferase [Leptonema sp. (in: Bacteria)]|nr:lauroyl acyltransferase [Leptonema sp. (in: bacteria)]
MIFITIRDFLIYVFVLILSIPFRLLSYPKALKLGTKVVRLLFPLFPKYRRIALENISKAFPEKNESELQEIFNDHLDHLGYLLADTFWKSKMTQKWFDKYVEYEPGSLEVEQEMVEQVKQTKVGFILVSGHIGTWENIVQFVGYRMHGSAVYKKIKNRFLDRWVEKQRGQFGTKMFTMDETGPLIKYLKQGGVAGLAADQNAGGAGIFIDFLNRPASTYRGPATIAYLTGAPIVFITLIHRGNGFMDLYLENLGSILKSDFPDKELAIREGTERWVKALERSIQKTPGQYFWVHRRWKTTPEMMEKLKAKK